MNEQLTTPTPSPSHLGPREGVDRGDELTRLNLGVREGEKVLFRLADGSEMSVELYALPTRRGSQAKFSIVAPRRVQILRERLARELPPGASLLSRRSNPAA